MDAAIEDGFLKIKNVLGKVYANGGPELHTTALDYYLKQCYPKNNVSIHEADEDDEEAGCDEELEYDDDQWGDEVDEDGDEAL